MPNASKQNKLAEISGWVVRQAEQTGIYSSYTEEAYRDILDAFERMTGLPPGSKVLDLGCATGEFSARLAARGYAVFSLDLSAKLLAIGSTRHPLKAVAADCEYLPIRSCSIEAVFCVDLLHHLPDTSLVLKEIFRVLLPGGRFFFSDLNGYNPHTFLAQSHHSPVRYDYLNPNESAVIPFRLRRSLSKIPAKLELNYVFLRRNKRTAASDLKYKLYGFILAQIQGTGKRVLAILLFNFAHALSCILPARFKANVVMGVVKPSPAPSAP